MAAKHVNFLSIRYSFTSETGEIGYRRYCNEYAVEIRGVSDDEEGKESSTIIGKASIQLFLIGLAIDNSFDLFELFDNSQQGQEIGNCIFDWENKEFIDEFQYLFMDAANNSVLYIDRIEILPEYQKKGFGKKVIKDIIYRFNQCCGLVVLKAFPLQLEVKGTVSGKDDKWNKRMKYHKLISDEKVACKQLFNFYKSVGFTRYNKTAYFYLSPVMINKKLDKIDLNEYFS